MNTRTGKAILHRCLGLVVLCMAGFVTGEAKTVLPNLISDGMVLQYGTPVTIWGKTDSCGEVNVTFLDRKYRTAADESGEWRITLPACKPGGPYTMQINELVVNDILVGNVFLCSGQSNMELMVSRVMDKYADEVNAYENTQIHYLKVPYCYDFNACQTDIKKAEWKPLTRKNVMQYGALCYFMAKELYEKTGIPVGIVNSSWGGTPIEAWISEDGLKDFPSYIHRKEMYESDELVAQVRKAEQMLQREWQYTLYATDRGLHSPIPWYAEDYDDSAWETVGLFSRGWATNGWRPVNGSHWFRKTVEVPSAWEGQEAVLRMGCIVDADSVFVNGTFVGTTAYQYPPRIYKVPAGILKAGRNQITVRLVSNGGFPSFVEEKPYKLICGQCEVSLEGDWKHSVGTEMPSSPSSTAFHCLPVGLYNGMIAPLKNWKFKCAVWYQGESNVGKWQEYASLLKTLAADWRSLFGDAELPFYIIELASFMKEDNPGRKSWTQLQMQQAEAARNIPHAVLIKNGDTGEWNDIHPLDKKTAAARLAAAILKQSKDY